MQFEYSYNIHDILKIKINTNNRPILKGFNERLSFFKTMKKISDFDITLNVGDFRPANEGCQIVDHKYYIKKNYLYCQDSIGHAMWKIEIKGVEKPPLTINFDGKLFNKYQYLAPDLLSQDLLLASIEFFSDSMGFF